jgi:nucleoside-diphosphate-sugar epimerase
MLTIAVTGGSGKLGNRVVRELLDRRYQVFSLDKRLSKDLPCRQIQTDLNDLGQVASALQGADAIIHLAAIPAPIGYPHAYIFSNNVLNGFHVLEAASLLGIRKVVMGSSTSCYGFAWADGTRNPVYVPVDEAHPHLAEEGYGLSKTLNELTGAMFARRCGMQVVSLRFSLIAAPEDYMGLIEGLRKLDRFKKILWSYIDIRDAVNACIAALEANLGGQAIALNITGDDTLSERDTGELLCEQYPEVTDIRADLRGSVPLFSNALAKQVLDWKPMHAWRDQR